MKTSQSFGVHFTIKKEKAKDGKTNVYACITVNKEKCFAALMKFVDVDIWDFGKGMLRGKGPEAKETNAYLKEIKFTITTYYQQLQLTGKDITPNCLNPYFLGKRLKRITN